jgi:ArsR family transcriptional regulator
MKSCLLDEEALDQTARLFRALGDVPRLRLVAHLAQGEHNVTSLAAEEGEQLSTVSQRLRVLRTEKIVIRRRQGKEIVYTLADRHVFDLVTNAMEHVAEPAGGPRPTDT